MSASKVICGIRSNSVRCGAPAIDGAHGRSVLGKRVWICPRHASVGFLICDLAAAHPITTACRHPDARWHDHGCEIPTVDDVRVPERELVDA